MRFKVGDVVSVVNISDENEREMLGHMGIIVDVDGEWVYPYEIDFFNGVKFDRELFAENELVLVTMKEEIHKIKIGKSNVTDLIEEMIKAIKDKQNSVNHISLKGQMNVTNAISKLLEAKMWIQEIEDYNKSR